MARVKESAAFRDALLKEGIDALLDGELDVGKSILRDFINATIGFERLAEATGTPSKSLMRMFSPSGNPNARNLFSVISELQHASGVKLRVARSSKSSQSHAQR
jgi:DNA-binding phage protein